MSPDTALKLGEMPLNKDELLPITKQFFEDTANIPTRRHSFFINTKKDSVTLLKRADSFNDLFNSQTQNRTPSLTPNQSPDDLDEIIYYSPPSADTAKKNAIVIITDNINTPKQHHITPTNNESESSLDSLDYLLTGHKPDDANTASNAFNSPLKLYVLPSDTDTPYAQSEPPGLFNGTIGFSDVTKIQSFARGVIARNLFKAKQAEAAAKLAAEQQAAAELLATQNNFATKIQSTFRMHQANKAVKSLKAEAKKLITELAETRVKHTAFVIEAINKAKDKISTSATQTIQSTIRAHQAKKELLALKKASKQIKAATKIQTLARGVIARNLFKAKQAEFAAKLAAERQAAARLLAKQNNAATKIQSTFRMHQAYNKLKSLKAEAAAKLASEQQAVAELSAKQNNAATAIQTLARGVAAKKLLKKTKQAESAAKLAAEQQQAAATLLANQNKAATKIQSTFRRHNEKNTLDELRAAKKAFGFAEAAMLLAKLAKNAEAARKAALANNTKVHNTIYGIVNMTSQITKMIADRRDVTMLGAGDETPNRKLWAKGFGSSAEQTGLHAAKTKTFGFTVGGDLEVMEDKMTLGAAYTHAKLDAKIKEEATVNSNINMGSIYSHYNFGKNTLLTTNASYGLMNVKNLTFKAVKNKADIFKIHGNLSHRFTLDNGVNITPKVGLSYDCVKIKDFKPAAGDKNRKANMERIVTDLALSLDKNIKVNDNLHLRPQIHGGINYIAKQKDPGYQTDQLLQNPKTPKTSYNLGASILAYGNNAVSLDLGYDFNWKSKYKAHSGFAKLEVKF